jgi:TonB-dependent SusC/RagA subfamily outer membrane receptor
MGLSYDAGVALSMGRISLRADGLTVAAALSQVLLGTGLRAYVAVDGHDILIRHSPPPRVEFLAHQQSGAPIVGRVTDGATRAPLDQVSVRVEGPGLGAVTTSDGRYTVPNVPPGAYRVTARRVGYQALSKDVTVAAPGRPVALDFALVPALTKLDEVVTTAVGDQRRYQVGNVISTIGVDSIAPTAPVTSLTDIISARAPGVEVIENSGLTGSGESIRIRGQSSLVLQADPIVIVDGVRQDNTAGGNNYSGPNGYPTPSRMNDIDFNDIETIDVLKGPAASTEYGTDAANGVIVITTKHGSVGRPRRSTTLGDTRPTGGTPR